MALPANKFIACLIFLGSVAFTRGAENCDVRSKNCSCVMPKLYDCPQVDLFLNPLPDGCSLFKDEMAGPNFSNLSCGTSDTFNPLPHGVSFIANGKWIEFENEACNEEFYFIVDLDGGKLVKTVRLEDMAPTATSGHNVSFEFAYGYTVPCTDQPTVNTLLWQYITPVEYAEGEDLSIVWNRLNFTDDVFTHNETKYFKASYLFIHFMWIPINSRFRLSMTGCNEIGKDIDPALDYLNNLLSVTNDTLEIAEGIMVSSPSLRSRNNLTDDEVALFLDAFELFENKSLDLSNKMELAQNLTQGLAEVASKIVGAISSAIIPQENEGYAYTTPAGPYTTAANTDSTSSNEDHRIADQQAKAVLAIEQAIGVVTAQAGNATIVAVTENVVVLSAPLPDTSQTDGKLQITFPRDPTGGQGRDGSGDEGVVAPVNIEVDLSVIEDILQRAQSSDANNTDSTPTSPPRFTALLIETDDFLDTNQTADLNTSAPVNDGEKMISTSNFINSNIFSLTVFVDGSSFSIPVEFQWENKREVEPSQNVSHRRNSESACVWLNEEEEWTDEGCTTIQLTGATNCICGHTTSFAVLVQVVDFEISKADTLAMTVLSYIGIGLSILCLVIALFIFFTVGALRTSERNMIHRNLMIALLLAYIVFLGGINYGTPIPVMCTIVAALLHYLYLAVFAWMLIEGIHLYLMLVKVFGSEGSKQIYYLIIGWGAPIIVVAISVGIRYKEYGTSEMCWLKPGSSVIWAFVGPVIAVILFNLFVLCMVLRIIYRSSAINADCPVDQVKAAAKGSLALLPILGITWCLGIFALGNETIVFQYLFVICNSTQGILLFVFHCLLNSEVRNALKREQEKMGWSTAGTATLSKRAKVHPEDTANSTSKSLTQGATKTTSDNEKSVAIYDSSMNKGATDPNSKNKPGPRKTDSEFSLPGQIGENLDEAQTSSIRQEIKTEREMEQGGWKINEKKHVQRTFVRLGDSQ
nr:adhesion G-protein coupled receptor G7-like [Lytechinus pictus]